MKAAITIAYMAISFLTVIAGINLAVMALDAGDALVTLIGVITFLGGAAIANAVIHEVTS